MVAAITICEPWGLPALVHPFPPPAWTALGSSLLTHGAEEALGVRHYGQEVFEAHVTISCGGQKNTGWPGAFPSGFRHCNRCVIVNIYSLGLMIKVACIQCRKHGARRKAEGKN